MVVDEPAIEDHAAMRRERARDDVGRVGMRAPVGRRADAALGIRFQHEAGEVRESPCRGRPPAPSTTR